MRISIQSILEDESIQIHFQPIISVAKQSVIGLEALTRAIHKQESIPPDLLFSYAREQHLVKELDYLCHECAIKQFSKRPTSLKNALLFINFDSSYISSDDVAILLEQLKRYEIAPENVVVEITEIENRDFSDIKAFAQSCKENHLIVSLDDIGSGFSNLDRLAEIKPHVVKCDKDLARNISHSFHQQEIIKSLIHLCSTTSSILVIEGVETCYDFDLLVSYGVQFIQGYYFEKPQPLNNIEAKAISQRIISTLSNNYNATNISLHKENTIQSIQTIFTNLVATSINELIKYLSTKINEFSFIECAYLLDKTGKQISPTLFTQHALKNQKQENILHHFFKPATQGSDHRRKKYYTSLVPPVINAHITERYRSVATGNPCITFSIFLTENLAQPCILCLDIIVK